MADSSPPSSLKVRLITLFKRLFPLLVTGVILFLLIQAAGSDDLLNAFSTLDVYWLIGGILLFPATILASGWRWQLMMKPFVAIRFWSAFRLVLGGFTLNVIMPSKLGDLMKAGFMSKEGLNDQKFSVGAVIFEKFTDLAAISVIFLVGLLIYPYAWHWLVWVGLGIASSLILIEIMMSWIPPDKLPIVNRIIQWGLQKKRLAGLIEGGLGYSAYLRNHLGYHLRILVLAVIIWTLHACQIWMFFMASQVNESFSIQLVVAPAAIWVGLLPITLGGIGTRDWAFIALLSPFGYGAASILAGSILVSMRYFVPALIGLPWLYKYLEVVRETKDSPLT